MRLSHEGMVTFGSAPYQGLMDDCVSHKHPSHVLEFAAIVDMQILARY